MSVSGWETECCFSVFNKFLSCYWNGFTWNMVELVGSRVNCLRVLFLLCELPGIRVGLLIACFTWNINWSFKLSHTSKPQNPTNTSKQIISIPTALTFHVKHQASATNRGKATHPKRYLLQLNHPIMFHVKPFFHIPHSTNLRFTWNIGKAQK